MIRWLAFVGIFVVCGCVSIDLRQPPAPTAGSNEAEAEVQDTTGIMRSVTPAPNKTPDPGCYLYHGEECIAPVIETTTLAPDPEPAPIIE